MRIERIHVTGFGRTRDLDLELDPGLTVIVGRNGAGKSTLAELIRAILFGFDPTRPYQPVDSALRGGWIEGRLRDGRHVRIERHGEKAGRGKLALRVDGVPVADPAPVLAGIMGTLDRATYESIFAFGLDDLAGLGRRTNDQIVAEILGPAVGPHVAVAQIEALLRTERDAIFRPKGTTQQVIPLLERFRELGDRLRASDPPAHYREARRRMTELEAGIAAQDREIGALRDALAAADRTARAIPAARIAAEAEAELSGLGALPDLDALEPVLAAAAGRIAGAEGARAAAEERLAAAEAARAATPAPDPLLLGLAGRIEELRADRARWTEEAARRERIRREMEAAEADARRVAAAAGAWCTPEWIVAQGAMGELRSLLRAAQERLVVAPRLRTEAARALVAEEAAALNTAVAALDALPPVEPEADRMTAAELRDAIADAEAATRERATANALRETALALPEGEAPAPVRGPGPRLALAIGGIAAVIGGAAAYTAPPAWLAGVPPTWAAAAWMAIAIVFTLLFINVQLARRSRRAVAGAGVRAAADHRATTLRDADVRIAAAEEALRAALERVGVADAEALPDARERLREVERREGERIAAAARREGAESVVATRRAIADAAEATLREAEADLATGRTEWRAVLAERGIAADLDGAHLDAALEAAREARGHLDVAAARRLELTAAERDQELRAERLRASVASLGITEADPDRLLEEAEGRIRGAITLVEADRAAEVERTQAAAAVEAAERAVAATRTDRAALLAGHGLADEDALAAAREQGAAAAELRRVRDEALATIATIAAGTEAPQTLAARAANADPDAANAEQARLRAGIADLEAERNGRTAELGAVSAEVARIAAETETGSIRAERETLAAQLRALATEHLVAAAGVGILAEARQRAEARHRPAVIAAAERWFTGWTGGEYGSLLAPGGRTIEAAVRRDGSLTGVTDLSRGTREQLYLALRLGLIDHYSERAEPLPLLMDEVLVDVDHHRLPSVLDAIEDVARRHQVIYLTFRPDALGLQGRRIDLDALLGLDGEDG